MRRRRRRFKRGVGAFRFRLPRAPAKRLALPDDVFVDPRPGRDELERELHGLLQAQRVDDRPRGGFVARGDRVRHAEVRRRHRGGRGARAGGAGRGRRRARGWLDDDDGASGAESRLERKIPVTARRIFCCRRATGQRGRYHPADRRARPLILKIGRVDRQKSRQSPTRTRGLRREVRFEVSRNSISYGQSVTRVSPERSKTRRYRQVKILVDLSRSDSRVRTDGLLSIGRDIRRRVARESDGARTARTAR